MDVERSDVEDQRAQIVVLREGDAALSWGDVAGRWRRDPAFCDSFTEALSEDPYEAFLWETPPVSYSTTDRRFEMVLVDAPVLARARPSPEPFEDQIGAGRGTDGVRTFDNLGGDACLVAPCANGPLRHYAHLGAFVRSGPRTQVRALWQAVGAAVDRRLSESDERFWVSTSGLGVYWVHVRLDSRPKYYSFAPYRR